MKKILTLFFTLFCILAIPAFMIAACPPGSPIILQKERIKPTNPGTPNPKSPTLMPTVYIDDYTVSFGSQLEGFELQILDEDGELVYSTVIPAGTTQAVLPSTLLGEYEIRFATDTYYYYSFITLE